MEGEYREGPVYVGLIVEAVYYPPEMINQGLLPVAVKPTGKYRQSFRQYEKNGDISLMVYVFCKSELESIQKVQQLIQKKGLFCTPIFIKKSLSVRPVRCFLPRSEPSIQRSGDIADECLRSVLRIVA